MKNGFFKALTALSLGLMFFQLSGCATFLDLGEEEDAPYDRGYAEERVLDPEADEDCSGNSACHTEAVEDSDEEALFASARRPAFKGDQRVRRAIETRDVILGMTRQDVMESWGEPSQREVAGRGTNGHERWTYGSRFSLGNSRTVIFENGRVAGWKR